MSISIHVKIAHPQKPMVSTAFSASKPQNHLHHTSKDREMGGAALNESRLLPQKKNWYQARQFNTDFSRMRHEKLSLISGCLGVDPTGRFATPRHFQPRRGLFRLRCDAASNFVRDRRNNSTRCLWIVILFLDVFGGCNAWERSSVIFRGRRNTLDVSCCLFLI